MRDAVPRAFRRIRQVSSTILASRVAASSSRNAGRFRRPDNGCGSGRTLSRPATMTTAAAAAAAAEAEAATIHDRIRSDHREILAWYHTYLAKKSDRKEAEKWKNQFVYELARHSAAEEVVVYPAFEQHLHGTGKAMADESRKEHDQIKADLRIVDAHKIKDSDEDYDAVMAKVVEELRVHIDKEEGEDIPRLMRALTPEQAVQMGNSFQNTKLVAPTHPHPAAPSAGGLGEQLAALLVKPMDKLRDALRTFPTRAECDEALAAYLATSSGKAVPCSG